MKRVRLRLKKFSETPTAGRFSSRETHLVGFDLEEVRPFRVGDHPASSSFDPLKSVLYKRHFLRIKRSERSARILFALDYTPSMRASPGNSTKSSVMQYIVGELTEGFAEGANEIGFLVWSSGADEYLEPVSGSVKARERLAVLSMRTPSPPPTETRPEKLFEYLLAIPRKPSIVFVFSDWYDTGDFSEALKKCLAGGLDIVPVILIDERETSSPRFLGNILLQSSESGEQCFAAGPARASSAENTFRSLGLPFIGVDIASQEDDWDKAFDDFFALREQERR